MQIIFKKKKKRLSKRANYIIASHIMFLEKGTLKQMIGRKAKLPVKHFFRKKFRVVRFPAPPHFDPSLMEKVITKLQTTFQNRK